jgi:hypothetical protein
MNALAHIEESSPVSKSDWHRLIAWLAARPKGRLIERALISPGCLHFTVTVDLKQDSVIVHSYQTLEE